MDLSPETQPRVDGEIRKTGRAQIEKANRPWEGAGERRPRHRLSQESQRSFRDGSCWNMVKEVVTAPDFQADVFMF